jgi:hypothetical protein
MAGRMDEWTDSATGNKQIGASEAGKREGDGKPRGRIAE